MAVGIMTRLLLLRERDKAIRHSYSTKGHTVTELSEEEIVREAVTGQVMDTDVVSTPSSHYCKHGTYVGSIYTADYICGACEQGE